MLHVPVGLLTNCFTASLPARPAAACPLEAVAGPAPALFPVLQNDTETFMSPEEANQTGNKPTAVRVRVEVLGDLWSLGKTLFFFCYRHGQQCLSLPSV